MNDNCKILYIVAGANGSGKSTLSNILLSKRQLEFLNADDIAKEISPNAINKVPISAGKIYFKRLNDFFTKEISFALESTLSGNNVLRIVSQAKSKNYKIVLIYSFLENCTVCIERVKKRVNNGGHSVPDEDIIRRYYKSIVNFWGKYRNLADEWSLFYNGLEYTPLIVAYGDKNNHVIINKDLQNKFNENLRFAKEKAEKNER